MDYPKSVPGVGLVGGKFVDENTATGQQGSLIPSAWGNAVTDEISNVIKDAGDEPAEGDVSQLQKAIRKIVAGAFGIGQAYLHDASGRYVAGITYTNTKTRPMWVRLRLAVGGGSVGSARIWVNGVEAAFGVGDSSNPLVLNTLVPAGVTWSFTVLNISSYALSVLE